MYINVYIILIKEEVINLLERRVYIEGFREVEMMKIYVNVFLNLLNILFYIQ